MVSPVSYRLRYSYPILSARRARWRNGHIGSIPTPREAAERRANKLRLHLKVGSPVRDNISLSSIPVVKTVLSYDTNITNHLEGGYFEFERVVDRSDVEDMF